MICIQCHAVLSMAPMLQWWDKAVMISVWHHTNVCVFLHLCATLRKCIFILVCLWNFLQQLLKLVNVASTMEKLGLCYFSVSSWLYWMKGRKELSIAHNVLNAFCDNGRQITNLYIYSKLITPLCQKKNKKTCRLLSCCLHYCLTPLQG